MDNYTNVSKLSKEEIDKAILECVKNCLVQVERIANVVTTLTEKRNEGKNS